MDRHNNKQLLRLAALVIILGLAGCQDVYIPELNVENNHLVVDGLITDQPGPHVVNLGYTGIYGELRHRRAATGATVFISDSGGREIQLQEFYAGQYMTPVGFSAEVGESYVLHIRLPDGEEYRSSPQEVRPPVKLENIEARVGSDFQYFDSNISDRLYQREFIGKHVYIETTPQKEAPPLFRFNTRLLLQYAFSGNGGGQGPPPMNYCWEYRDITKVVRREVSRPESNRIRTAFIPRSPEEMRHYNFPPRTYMSPKVIMMELYALNKESHNYYLNKYNQLSDEGHIFDPIAAQLPSNIECVGDPDNQAFGLFEASAVSKRGFRIIMNYRENTAAIYPWSTTAHISTSGCLVEERPPFWISLPGMP